MTQISSSNFRNLKYEQLAEKWSKECVTTLQLLAELAETQNKLENLENELKKDGLLTANQADHLRRMLAINLDSLSCELLNAEREEAVFIKDGGAPVGGPDHDKNQRDLAATLKGTIAAFRD